MNALAVLLLAGAAIGGIWGYGYHQRQLGAAEEEAQHIAAAARAASDARSKAAALAADEAAGRARAEAAANQLREAGAAEVARLEEAVAAALAAGEEESWEGKPCPLLCSLRSR